LVGCHEFGALLKLFFCFLDLKVEFGFVGHGCGSVFFEAVNEVCDGGEDVGEIVSRNGFNTSW
jgi:hypothetical protein